MRITASAFSKIITALEKNPKAWVAGCKLLNTDGTEQAGNRRNILKFKNMISEWFGLYKYMFMPRLDLFETIAPKGSSYVPAISGAFMMMRKEKYKEIGGMDKKYFLDLEDMDFCFRVNDMGGRVIFVSDLEVVHHGHTSDADPIIVAKHKTAGLVRYFRKNFSGAYFPGALIIITVILYIRLVLQIIKLIFKRSRGDYSVRRENKENYNKAFLEGYTDFIVEPKTDIRDPKYYINNRAPILITDGESPIGLCLIRRLLGAGVNVVAICRERPIDIYHPNLTWMIAKFGRQKLDFINEIKPKTVICTSDIQYLPPYLDQFAMLGAKRIICFNSLSIFGANPTIETKRRTMAEQNIARICKQRGMDYTIFRTSLVYGLGSNDAIGNIYKFIKKFGFFPSSRDSLKIYQPVHADDMSISALKVLNMENTFGKSYNLFGGGKTISYNDIITRIFIASGKKSRLIKLPPLSLAFDMYAKFAKKDNLNKKALEYQNSQEAKSTAEAKEDFGFYARSFLKVTHEDLGF